MCPVGSGFHSLRRGRYDYNNTFSLSHNSDSTEDKTITFKYVAIFGPVQRTLSKDPMVMNFKIQAGGFMDIILFGYLSEKNNIFFSFQFTNLVPLMKHWECCGHKGCIVIRRVWFKLPLRRNISSLITPVNEMVLTQNDVIWAMLTNLQCIYC